MSVHFMQNGEAFEPKYGKSRTKQSFKDETDVNKLIKKAQITGSIAHLERFDAAAYAEFDGFDLHRAYRLLEKAEEIFAALPSELRHEFENSPANFITYANDPANRDQLEVLLPLIAEPGRYFPNPVFRGGQGAGAATAPASAPSGAEASGASETPTPPASDSATQASSST